MLKVQAKIRELTSHLGIKVYLLVFGFGTQIISILHQPNSRISDSDNPFCNFYISKFNIFHVHLDCDAQYFLLDSQNPMRIINNQTPLQDRPLHTFLVFVTAKVLELVGVPAGPITYLGDDGIPQTYNLLNYALFIGINIIILFVAMTLVLKVILAKDISRTKYTTTIVIISLVLLVQNPITREFFWTPHSQLFNILIPSLLFYIAQQDFVINKKNYLVLMFSISICLLVYPTFFIVLPIFFIKTYRSLGGIRAFLISICLIPKLLWPFILNLLGGHYTDWPLTYHRRFIWISDAFGSGTLWKEASSNLLKFLNSLPFSWTVIFLLLFSLGTYIFFSQDSFSRSNLIQRNRDLVLSLGIYSVGIILNGAYGPRFTTGITILFSLIVLQNAMQVRKNAGYWWIPYLALFVLNSWYWLSN